MHGGIDKEGNVRRDPAFFDVDLETIEYADAFFDEQPTATYRSGQTSSDLDFFIGGATVKAGQSRLFESENLIQDPFKYDRYNDLPESIADIGVSFSSILGGIYSNNKYIFIVGGKVSGRGDGFLQIRNTYNPSEVRLDGKQSAVLNYFFG